MDYFDGDVTIISPGSRARGGFKGASDYDLVVVYLRKCNINGAERFLEELVEGGKEYQ